MLFSQKSCGSIHGFYRIVTVARLRARSRTAYNHRSTMLSASLDRVRGGAHDEKDDYWILFRRRDDAHGNRRAAIELILSTTSASGFNFLVQTAGQGVYQVQLGIAVEAAATTNALPAGAKAMVAVGAASLVEMIVQAQTPFDTIKLCHGGSASGTVPSPCGPQ